LGSFQAVSNASNVQRFKYGWRSTNGGSKPIVFKDKAKRITVVYQTGAANTGHAVVRVNGVPMAVLEGQSSSGGYINFANWVIEEYNASQNVEVSVQPIDGKQFTLVGLWLCT
jgi:hypothetical protein